MKFLHKSIEKKLFLSFGQVISIWVSLKAQTVMSKANIAA